MSGISDSAAVSSVSEAAIGISAGIGGISEASAGGVSTTSGGTATAASSAGRTSAIASYIFPSPNSSHWLRISGKVRRIFVTKSKLGLFRPPKTCDKAERCTPMRSANCETVKFWVCKISAILFSIMYNSKFNFATASNPVHECKITQFYKNKQATFIIISISLL